MLKKLKISIVLVLIFFLINVFSFTIFMPKFDLYSKNGDKIKNTEYEYPEQILLYKNLKGSDIVLQLGGNIGTSCLLADKILHNQDKQICVEPNKDVIKTLEKNKKLHNASFNIINGIISNKVCSYKKDESNNDLMKLGVSYHYDDSLEVKEDITCFDFYEIERNFGGNINVLFFDCEGCACEFLEMYEDKLKDITKVFIEQDKKDRCDYAQKVFPLLKKHNFTSSNNFISVISDGFYQFWYKK